MKENLDAFFDLNDFAINVTYQKQNGENVTIKAIYDNEYRDVSVGDVQVEGYYPVLFCKTADIPDVRRGSLFIINGSVYKVINVRHDHSGVTTLVVSKNEWDDV